MQGKDKLILETALKLFLEKGYENTNIKDIIEIIGGSNATIYKKFNNKNQLFLACLELRRDRNVKNFFEFINLIKDLQLEEFLSVFAFKYFNIFCNEENARFIRLIVTRSYHDKVLQGLIDKADKNIIVKELANIFERKISKEILKDFSAFELANMYCSMIRADKFFDLFFDTGKALKYDEEDIKKHIKKVNDFFLKVVKINR